MAIQKTRRGEAMLENVRLIWRNFAGKQTQFNRAGNRHFDVVLTKEMYDEMKADGWNVKVRDPREEGDDPLYHLPVKVNMDSEYPPQILYITDRGRTRLDRDTVDLIDGANIQHVDLVLNPYRYDVNGNQGIAAYLTRAYITIEEDALERKYSEVPEGAAGSVNVSFEDFED